MPALTEQMKLWKAHWKIERFACESIEDVRRLDLRPYLVTEFEENIALNTGKAEIWALVIGDSAAHFNNTNARIGVGDSSTAAANTQTDLQAAVNKAYGKMESSYPQQSTTTTTDDTVEFQSSFGSGDANFSWQEFVIKENTGGVCLNRKVSNQGTKASGQTWLITLKLQATGS